MALRNDMHMHPEEDDAIYVLIHEHAFDDDEHSHPEIGMGKMEELP